MPLAGTRLVADGTTLGFCDAMTRADNWSPPSELILRSFSCRCAMPHFDGRRVWVKAFS
jgi:hypothetical protein